MINHTYLEHGKPVVVRTRWQAGKRPDAVPLTFGAPARGTPRNVLIERESGERVVRPFRGLRKVEGER